MALLGPILVIAGENDPRCPPEGVTPWVDAVRANGVPVEVEFYAANRDRIQVHWAKDQARWDMAEIVAPLEGRPVYITFDIDALDSAIMPATGTPTPGGLGYWQALGLLRRACAAAGRVVGADLVEFAPIAGLHACDYTAAALAYKLLAYALSGR